MPKLFSSKYTAPDILKMKSEFVQGLIDENMLKIAPHPTDQSQWFKLKTPRPDGSPNMSPVFWSIQDVQGFPHLQHLVVPLLACAAEAVSHKFDVTFNKVVGVPEGMTATAANVGYILNKGILTVRKQEKSHGQKGSVIGNLQKEDSVLILEDVGTSGMSIFKEVALKMFAQTGGINATDVIIILDREQGAEKNLARGFYEFNDGGIQVITNAETPYPLRMHSLFTQSSAIEFWNPADAHGRLMKPVIMKYIADNMQKAA